MPALFSRTEAVVPRELDLHLSPAPEAPALGRRALERLSEAIGRRRLADVELIASELITNSVLHGGLDEAALVHVRVRVGGRRVRIEVEDPGRGFEPRPVPAAGMDAGGRGLHLVDRLSSRWGFSRTVTTLVWAEIDDDAPAAA
jgi:anti-sigma regulatory factor (Ser/Thr protein kinase)